MRTSTDRCLPDGSLHSRDPLAQRAVWRDY